MNVYTLLKLNSLVTNHRIKFFGLYLLHIFNKRYLAINLDPVLACNLRCKMCYFTDKEYVKKLKGSFKKDEIETIAETVFSRALKLQIGCGTEPTLYKNLPRIVELGKKYQVPYISITTNANLLTIEKIEALLDAGLNEFTISLHGVTKETYEGFMKNADYDKFHEVLNFLKICKEKYTFKIRINYTFNNDNFLELKDFFKYFNGNIFDILQIRPIQKIGDTEYNNFDLSNIKDSYSETLNIIKKNCKKFNITLLAPNTILTKNKFNPTSVLFQYTFCYISPRSFWREDFDWKNESFNEFSKRIGWKNQIFSNIFKSKKQLESLSNHLNYEINL